MAKPEEKSQEALNESRILVLGTQVLLGFQYSAALEPAFAKLSLASKYLELIALTLLMIAFGLFVSPAPSHLLAWSGEDGSSLQTFVTSVVEIALLPFAAVLAIDVYLSASVGAGFAAGSILGAVTFTCAMFCWYGLEAIHVRTSGYQNRSRARRTEVSKNEHGIPSTEEKIQHAMTDTRVVLPGAQALLGFQLVAVLLGGFEDLPTSSKYVHIASLVLITLSTILLMMPAAYHRLVEDGEPSEHFYSVVKRAILASMIPLGAGISGDFFVVTRKVSGSLPFAYASTILLLSAFYLLWFALPLFAQKTAIPPHEVAP
jgi:hypothetical protein